MININQSINQPSDQSIIFIFLSTHRRGCKAPGIDLGFQDNYPLHLRYFLYLNLKELHWLLTLPTLPADLNKFKLKIFLLQFKEWHAPIHNGALDWTPGRYLHGGP